MSGSSYSHVKSWITQAAHYSCLFGFNKSFHLFWWIRCTLEGHAMVLFIYFFFCLCVYCNWSETPMSLRSALVLNMNYLASSICLCLCAGVCVCLLCVFRLEDLDLLGSHLCSKTCFIGNIISSGLGFVYCCCKFAGTFNESLLRWNRCLTSPYLWQLELWLPDVLIVPAKFTKISEIKLNVILIRMEYPTGLSFCL